MGHEVHAHPNETASLTIGVFGAAGNAALLSLHVVNPCYILNHMVQYCQPRFDASFGALSDATRRGVLEQLGRADASITTCDLVGLSEVTLHP